MRVHARKKKKKITIANLKKNLMKVSQIGWEARSLRGAMLFL